MKPGWIFSLGGLFRLCIRRGPAWMPWAAAAGLLAMAASWDPISHGGQVDFVLLGLAGYELILGLTDDTPSGARPFAG